MQEVIDVIYLSSSFYKTDAIAFKSVLADLREKVSKHLKEGWVLNGGITVSDVSCFLTIIQPMAKYRQEQEQDLLPVRRKPDST